MPYYKGLFDQLDAEGNEEAVRRTARCLLALRRQLKKQGVPSRNLTQTLLLATWNLREFGKNAKYGARLPESLQYIAEIISHFDLVAVQEVNQRLDDLKVVMGLLGSWWDYIVTDVTEGRSGNEERIAFIFDSRKVRFDHVAGEVVFPEKKRSRVVQAARSPFLCTFKAGWRRFSLCSVHIYYGQGNPNDPRRVKEIATLATLLAERNARRSASPDGEPDNIVLLGDFNIFNRAGDKTSKALDDAGFVVPKAIKEMPGGSNLKGDKFYDQIAFHDPGRRLRATSKAGVFDFQKAVFGKGDHRYYMSEMAKTDGKKFHAAKDKAAYFDKWRTFQVSDHLPLWVELTIDFSQGYLATRGGFNGRGRRSAQGGGGNVGDGV
jgi:endonuclease/exonuclease/phosphatase family metal-dependent hydrolase